MDYTDMTKIINIAEDFNQHPGGRSRAGVIRKMGRVTELTSERNSLSQKLNLVRR